MNINKKNKDRYIVEINDWGCGTLIKDTLTGKEIDAPAEETVNLCIKEMNRLSEEIENLRNAGDEMANAISFAMARTDGKEPALVRNWNSAKEGKTS